RIHRLRFHRSWTDDDGAFCYRGRTSLEQGRHIHDAVKAAVDTIFRDALGEGRREPEDAYALDALAEICARSLEPTPTDKHPGRTVPKIRAKLRVDLGSLVRGETMPGETCEIAGLGPVSVRAARELLGDALLDIVVTNGIDVRTIVAVGRTIRE